MRHELLVLLQILVFICLFTPPAYAQWPSELETGINISNNPDEFAQIIEVCEDSSGIAFVYRIGSLAEYLLQKIDYEGNQLWDDGGVHFRQNEGWYSSDLSMAVAEDGSVWILYETFIDAARPYPGSDPLNSALCLQKVEPDGDYVQQWQFIVSPYRQVEYNSHGNECGKLIPLEDGGVIVVWWEGSVYETGYEGGCFVQRYSEDFEEMWQPGGINLGISRCLNPVVLDDYSMMFVIHGECLVLDINGNLRWERGSVVIDSLDQELKTYLCKSDDDKALFISTQSRNSPDFWLSGFDSTGTLPWGQGFWLNYDFHVVPSSRKTLENLGNNEYGVVFSNARDLPGSYLMKFDNNLDFVFENEYLLLSEDPAKQFACNANGIRYSTQVSINDSTMVDKIFAFDTDGNHLWDYQLSDDAFYYYETKFEPFTVFDRHKNTFVLWIVHEGNSWYASELYVNIIDQYGNWGYPHLGVENLNTSIKLNGSITISSYPNPFNSLLNIAVNSQNPHTHTSITIYDILGRKLTCLNSKNDPVSSRFVWDASNYSSGTYFIYVEDDNSNIGIQKVHLIE